MLREARLPVLWHAYSEDGVEDDRGNVQPGHLPPVTVYVYGFAPSGFDEPVMPGHDRTVQVPTLYTPPSVVFGALDQVTVHGLLYDVQGDTRVWQHPNGSRPGNVIELKRVSG